MSNSIFWIGSDEKSLEEIESVFGGYNKVAGIILCRKLRLPGLEGFFVDTNQSVDCDKLIENASHLGHQVLIRHDRRPETGQYPQGGYLIPLGKLVDDVMWYKNEGRIVLCLSPVDPLCNRHSATISITSDQLLTMEIVGVGFDTSDITRGFISPHERYVIQFYGNVPCELAHYVVPNEVYQFDKQLRMEKIYKKDIERQRYFRVVGDEYAIVECRRMILEHKWLNGLLTKAPYIPASRSFISRLAKYARTIMDWAQTDPIGRQGNTIAFAASEVNYGRRVVVWDIVLPRRKYV